MLTENNYQKYFYGNFDQEHYSSIKKDSIFIERNKKSLICFEKNTIIKASKANSLARTKIIDQNNQGSLATVKVTYCAETDRTSKARNSLSETAQALVKRFPIVQLMIGIWYGVRMSYIQNVWRTALNKIGSFQHRLLQGEQYV